MDRFVKRFPTIRFLSQDNVIKIYLVNPYYEPLLTRDAIKVKKKVKPGSEFLKGRDCSSFFQRLASDFFVVDVRF